MIGKGRKRLINNKKANTSTFLLKNEDSIPFKYLFTKKHGEAKPSNIDPEKDILKL